MSFSKSLKPSQLVVLFSRLIQFIFLSLLVHLRLIWLHSDHFWYYLECKYDLCDVPFNGGNFLKPRYTNISAKLPSADDWFQLIVLTSDVKGFWNLIFGSFHHFFREICRNEINNAQFQVVFQFTLRWYKHRVFISDLMRKYL